MEALQGVASSLRDRLRLIEGTKEIRREEYFGESTKRERHEYFVRRPYKQQVTVCEPIFYYADAEQSALEIRTSFSFFFFFFFFSSW